MLSAGSWKRNQPNSIFFVLVNSDGEEVSGLGSVFTLNIAKADGIFLTGLGTKNEIGLGWYRYTSTVSEADMSGPIAITVQGSGTVQQNLEYVVEDRVITAIEFTYTVTSTVGNVPIEGVYVVITTDSMGINPVWTGYTDAFGIARDISGNLPRLDPGVYFIYRQKSGFIFNDPDQEIVQ